MKIRMELNGASQAIVSVAGDVDLTTASELKETLLCLMDPVRAPVMIIDLREVPFLDSRGLSALVSAQRHATQVGLDLRVAGASRGPAKVLRITGLDQYLDLYRSRAEAEQGPIVRLSRATGE